MEPIVLLCPHCQNPFIMEKLNCGIFRHGIYKDSNNQMNPHSSEEICNKVVQEDLIYGCGKPFQIVQEKGQYIVKICDYI